MPQRRAIRLESVAVGVALMALLLFTLIGGPVRADELVATLAG